MHGTYSMKNHFYRSSGDCVQNSLWKPPATATCCCSLPRALGQHWLICMHVSISTALALLPFIVLCRATDWVHERKWTRCWKKWTSSWTQMNKFMSRVDGVPNSRYLQGTYMYVRVSPEEQPPKAKWIRGSNEWQVKHMLTLNRY